MRNTDSRKSAMCPFCVPIHKKKEKKENWSYHGTLEEEGWVVGQVTGGQVPEVKYQRSSTGGQVPMSEITKEKKKVYF